MPKVHEEVLMRKLKKRLKHKEKQRIKNRTNNKSNEDKIGDNSGDETEDIENKRKIEDIDDNKTSIIFNLIPTSCL